MPYIFDMRIINSLQVDVEIQGILTADGWCTEGNINRLKLCTPGEIDYVLIGSNIITKLKPLINENIKVIGKVYNTDLGHKAIEVAYFQNT